MIARELQRGERRIACWLDHSAAPGDLPGADARVPAVFLHAGPGFAHDHAAPFAGGRGGGASGLGRVAAYFDWPGCGRSSRHPGSGYPLDEYVADVDTVRAGLHARSIVPIAHGWGAIPAVEYALAHPAHVAAIVLVNPLRILSAPGQDHDAQSRCVQRIDPDVLDTYVGDVLPDLQRAIAGDVAAWETLDASPWWARMWRTQFHRPPPVEWVQRVSATRFGLESYFAHKGRAMFDAASEMATFDLAERIARVSAPVLILGSPTDANYVAPVDIHARPLAQAAPRGEYAELAASGHFPFVEVPETYRAALGDFFDRLGV